MKTYFFWLLFMLLGFSCKRPMPSDMNVHPEEQDPTVETHTNCDTISLRQDGNDSFYEENPTYENVTDTVFKWNTASFAQAEIDSTLFLLGEPLLENHSTLFSFLLIRADALVYERYFHGSSAAQSNNIHSASKCILSALAGIAIHQGFLDTDSKVLDFFPAYVPDNPQKAKIKLEHLLNMTSGLAWEEDYTEYFIEEEPHWVNAILDRPLAYEPGSVFNYSTGNTHLLSAVLQEAVGENVCDFMYANLMSDLGVVVEHWGKDPQGYFSGGYNFYISPREMAQFGLLYLNEGRLDGKQLLPASWVQKSLSPQIEVDEDYSYSYGWWVTEILGKEVYQAWGYGGQYICLIPDLDVMVVSTANTHGSTYAEFDMDSFLEEYVIPAIL